ncbi:hypothetical protein V8C26DRAFT_409107 [Trichoderma gracile]
MALPSLPMAAPIRRVTSAAFVVRYFSVTPPTGSYVFRTRLPRGGLAAAAAGVELVVVVVSGASVVVWSVVVVVDVGGLRGLTGLME